MYNGLSRSTPPSYGRKRFREDDPGSGGRSFRRRGNDDFHLYGGPSRGREGRGFREEEPPPPPVQKPIDRFRADLWKLGDEDSPAFGLDAQSLLAAARHAEDMFNRYRDDLCDGFRIAILELPHKLPHLACILSLMDRRAAAALADVDGPTAPSAGNAVTGHLIETFSADIVARQWRNVRFYMHFFAHLASLPRPLVGASSLVKAMASFAAVTEEYGVGAQRADECARIVLEARLRLSADVDAAAIMSTVGTYIESRRYARSCLFDSEVAEQYEDPLESLFAACADGEPLTTAPHPERLVVDQISRAGDFISTPHVLPVVTIPLDTDVEGSAGYAGTRIQLKLFDDDTVPPREGKDSSYLRTLVASAADVYEVNRKDAAKYLLELPRWLAPHVFKSKAGAEPDMDTANGASTPWIFEHVVIETILSSLFALPAPQHKAIYYHSLVIELCKLAPATIAPAMGKCVRRIYAGIGEGPSEDGLCIDAEGARRFCEWFSIHLSNFGFSWRWTEWQDDLSLPVLHPKRAVIDRILELEVRLSYFERIKEPLPAAYKSESAMSGDAPAPAFAFEDPDHPRHAAANNVVELMRGRAKVEDIRSELDTIRASLQEDDKDISTEDLDTLQSELALQGILNVGSRSFSHLLNVLERYIELIRELSSTPDARRRLLDQCFGVWQRNPQFLLILIDKMLQYRIVEYREVVAYLFAAQSFSGFLTWDLLRSCLSKAIDRIRLLTIRVETAAGIAAGEGVEKAQEQLDAARKESEDVVFDAAMRLAELYAGVIDGDATMKAGTADDDPHWSAWWLRGWFREFVRLYSPQLASLHDRLRQALPPSSPARDLLVEGPKKWEDFIGKA